MFGIAIMIFTMLVWMSPGVSVYVFLHYFFKAGYELEVSKIAIFIKLLTELINLTIGLPASFQFLSEIAVSLKRIDLLLSEPDAASLRG